MSSKMIGHNQALIAVVPKTPIKRKPKAIKVDVVVPDIDVALKTKRKNSTIIKEGQDKPKVKKENHYVDNEKFFKELIQWQQDMEYSEANDTVKPKIPEYIGSCILKICERLSSLHYFAKYPYRDEMVLNAIENCIKKLRNFNAKKTANPFAYYTQISYYSFISTIADENKRKYNKYRHILDKLASGNLASSPEYTSDIAEHIMDNVELQVDYLQEFVSSYEAKNKAKVIAAKKSKMVDDLIVDEDDNEGAIL